MDLQNPVAVPVGIQMPLEPVDMQMPSEMQIPEVPVVAQMPEDMQIPEVPVKAQKPEDMQIPEVPVTAQKPEVALTMAAEKGQLWEPPGPYSQTEMKTQKPSCAPVSSRDPLLKPDSQPPGCQPLS